VYPSEIENVLHAHPAIAEAGVSTSGYGRLASDILPAWEDRDSSQSARPSHHALPSGVYAFVC
jgi:hypothetical protein